MSRGFHYGREELRRELRNDCIASDAPEIHAAGKPINQQAKTGLGAPRFSVVAGDPFCAGPERLAVAAMRCTRGMPVSCGRIVPFPRRLSVVVGVGHVATIWRGN